MSAQTVYDLIMGPHIYSARKHGLSLNAPEVWVNGLTNHELLEAISEAIEQRLAEERNQRDDDL